MRGTYVAALFLFGVALAACTSAVSQTTESDPPPTTVATTVGPVTTTVAESVPTTETEPDYSVAQTTLDAWATAIATDDVDAAMATHSVDPDDLVGVREAMGYLAAVTSEAVFNDCRFSTPSASKETIAACDLTLMDPILVATGNETVRVTWRLSEDGTAILSSEPGNRLNSRNLFVSYAQEQYSDEFAEVCGAGTVNYNGLVGWAFNRACGEFTADIADEVVDAMNETSYTVAQETLHTWAEAIAADDVDAAMTTHSIGPNDYEDTREVIGYLAAVPPEAEFSDCSFSVVSRDSQIRAECDLTLLDPILVATGMETVQVIWRLNRDGTAIVRSEPGARMSPRDMTAKYALEKYRDEFTAVCGEGTVNYHLFVGWAFNRGCGEFTASIAGEIVDAINAAG